MTDLSFGGRLRRERERRQIALSSIAANTKINMSLFEALERDDVSRWPAGIFRRAFIRAYAEAIGLDAGAVTSEFVELFPDGTEETTAPCQGSVVANPLLDAQDSGLRIVLADAEPSFLQDLLSNAHQRCLAVVLDLAVVVALGWSAFLIFGTFWMPLGISALCYYGLALLFLGRTPGVYVSGRSLNSRLKASRRVLELGRLQDAFGHFPSVAREERLDGL